MPSARVTFLGTGTSHGVPMIGCRCAVCRSGDPHDRRSRPSIHVAVQDGPAILVDTATDLRAQALANDITRVDAVLFTHAHADHVMGLDEVRRFNVLSGRRIPIESSRPWSLQPTGRASTRRLVDTQRHRRRGADARCRSRHTPAAGRR